MDLDIIEGSVWFGPLVSVARVAIHVPVRVWCTTVTKEVHDLVDSLLVSGKVVPEHGSVLQICLWVSLLCVDEERELGRIAEEEDWGVIVDPVPVALLGVKLDSETSGVTSSVWRTLLTADSGETKDKRGLLAGLAEHVNGGDVGDVVCNFELCDHNVSTSIVQEGQLLIVPPYAPAPLACTTRSGIRSRSKWASRSIKWKS